MEKLIEIQNELKAAKSNYNSFGKYKYRSCEDILEALKPLLKAKGLQLTLSDEIKHNGEFSYVEATATIQGDKVQVWVKAQAGIKERKGMDLAQSFGASSSYARKYALCGLFLLDDTKDADTMKAPEKPELKPNTTEWTKAVEYLQGDGTISDIEAKYTIRDREKLLSDSILRTN